MKKIRLITIGKSPQTDILPNMMILRNDYEVFEVGALDNHTIEEIRQRANAIVARVFGELAS